MNTSNNASNPTGQPPDDDAKPTAYYGDIYVARLKQEREAQAVRQYIRDMIRRDRAALKKEKARADQEKVRADRERRAQQLEVAPRYKMLWANLKYWYDRRTNEQPDLGQDAPPLLYVNSLVGPLGKKHRRDSGSLLCDDKMWVSPGWANLSPRSFLGKLLAALRLVEERIAVDRNFSFCDFLVFLGQHGFELVVTYKQGVTVVRATNGRRFLEPAVIPTSLMRILRRYVARDGIFMVGSPEFQDLVLRHQWAIRSGFKQDLPLSGESYYPPGPILWETGLALQNTMPQAVRDLVDRAFKEFPSPEQTVQRFGRLMLLLREQLPDEGKRWEGYALPVAAPVEVKPLEMNQTALTTPTEQASVETTSSIL